MSLSNSMQQLISQKSFIRVMFEKGSKLKKIHGADNVYDFSIGNPNIPPPEAFSKELVKAAQSTAPFVHGYTPNSGIPETRQAIAKQVSIEQKMNICFENIIVTCGAAGGINVALKVLINPDEEIIVPSPYFVEYGHYAVNASGKLVPVNTKEDFSLDLKSIAAKINPKTKVILVNSPNNPTGQVYSEESMRALGELLRKKSQELGHIIYLISDEPYRKIVFDGIEVPSVFEHYENSIVVTSYSKDLSIPGERMGYIAVNPRAQYGEDLLTGMILVNRTLGFVNAPALIQRVIAKIQGQTVDVRQYEKKRQLLCDGLNSCGIAVDPPPGTFYLFVKSPISDDIEFVEKLQKQLILAVPGSAFGAPGYFRLSYCVDDDTIINAIPGFKSVMARLP